MENERRVQRFSTLTAALSALRVYSLSSLSLSLPLLLFTSFLTEYIRLIQGAKLVLSKIKKLVKVIFFLYFAVVLLAAFDLCVNSELHTIPFRYTCRKCDSAAEKNGFLVY